MAPPITMSLSRAARSLVGRVTGRRTAAPEDSRGGRILLVIECLLNQNARDQGAAVCPAMSRELVALCQEHDVGLVQIPCPEIRALGWHRRRPAGHSIRQALDTAAGRASCRELARETVGRIQQYREGGIRPLGVVGGNALSPGCAVHHGREGDTSGPLQQGSGLLMTALRRALDDNGMTIPIVPLRDADEAARSRDLERLRKMLEQA